MKLLSLVDIEGRLPLFFAAGALVVVFGVLGIFATTGSIIGESTPPGSASLPASLPSPDAGEEIDVSRPPENLAQVPEASPPTPPDPGPEPAAPEEVATTATRHRVQHGESLYGIARTYYGSGQHWRVLSEANDLDEGVTHLRVGQILQVPPLEGLVSGVAGDGGSSRAVANVGPDTVLEGEIYVIQPGDTWWRIASQRLGRGTEWPRLASANPNLDASRPLQVGQRLLIPSSE
jgi:nucleoid-associated protein YgaU